MANSCNSPENRDMNEMNLFNINQCRNCYVSNILIQKEVTFYVPG